MRRIIVSMNISIDGFLASPEGALDWQFNYWTSEMARVLGEQLGEAGTILLGRNTYVAMAAYWPSVSCGLSLSRDDIAYAMLMNSYPKMVCSNTLKSALWHNTHLIGGGIDQKISNLKKQPGKDIIIYGSQTLVLHLTQKKLIDEYRLWVYPVTLGRGVPLFNQQVTLRLSSSRQFESGVVLLTYHPHD
ncbi:dihydrofolate reductase family protein [Mucilaginibacter antarcticus]|uniref:Dihydrofolate reductase family protein n=1 Tax=Mucilaginibacter antarcticus TaxID=1855725 RepID=A0ABW5XQ52_9SPHI